MWRSVLIVLLIPVLLAGLATAPGAAPAGGDWASSFEGDLVPPDEGQVAVKPDGQPDVAGVTRPGSARAGLRTVVDDGPDRAYAAKANAGFTGLHALRYSGEHKPDGPAHSVNVLAEDLGITVGPDTELSYVIFPGLDEQTLDYASTYVALDLAFTDGTRLSGLGATDQNRTALTARAQGASATMFPLQWNDRSVAVGALAAGKVIDQVLLAYDGPAGPAVLDGWIDDLAIVGAPARPDRVRPSDWVVTTRGTQSNGGYSRGNNIPAAAMPNGFNFWTPVTDAASLSELYSYHQDNNAENRPEIQAFTASHQTSIWMGDRQTFQFMPSAAQGVPDPDRTARALPFQHTNEQASPHRYGVTFDNGLRTEIAPTEHAAVVRVSFPPGGGRHLVFDNVDDRSALTIDAAAGTVTGWSETRTISAGMSRMYVYASFDNATTAGGALPGHRPSTGYVSFADDVVTMRIATSLISVDQARRNLELEAPAGTTFEQVTARAQQAWDERLGVIEVEGASEDQLTTLYSNLYRLFLYPNSGYENTGTNEQPRYRHAVQSTGSWTPPPSSPTETGAPVVDGKVYVNTGFWDTFRTAWPAYSLLAPDVAGELVDGFVQQYRDGGWISPWSSPGYARVMTGTSSDLAFADAVAKQVPGIDVEDTYAAALKNATVRPPDNSVGRDGLERSLFLGYVPNDVGAGFSWSLDGYMNDFGVAALADAKAQQGPEAERKRAAEEAEYFRGRALGYADVFDPSIGFFQGKDVNGTQTTPAAEYDPKVWGNDHDYTEANGWNEAFPAPYDGQGLAELYGGRDGLAAKLDEFFATPETARYPGSYGWVIHEMLETRDLRLGQWSIPNQVSHHIPWMYNFTQQPWKAQQRVRQALDRGWLGSAIGQGYPGDEDNGATSAWWIMSALGLYPLQHAGGEYTIGSPLFEKATLHLPGGDVVIEAPGTSGGGTYVQALTVDGVPHGSTTLRHADLADGAVLRFTMGPEPSAWGTGAQDVPGSQTEVGERPRPWHDVTGPNRGVTEIGTWFDNTSATEAKLTGMNPSTTYRVNGGDRTEVEFYTLTSNAAAPAEDPSHWLVEGSDDGVHWRVLDRRGGEDFAWRNQTRPFKLQAPASAAQYRIRFLSEGRQQVFSLSEVEFLTRDDIPGTPLNLEVSGAALRAGTSAPVEIGVTNTGTEAVSPKLSVTVPAGWSADPAKPSVPALAPGESATATVTVTAPANAAPGTVPIRVDADVNGWAVQGTGSAQVIGDVTTIEPGTAAEAEILTDDRGSQLTGDGGGQARFADGQNSFTYLLPVPANDTPGTVTLDLANQFLVEVSSDGQNWTQVLREPEPVMFQANRGQRVLDLADLRAQAGGPRLYLRVSDSHPQDGWGGWLAGLRLELTTG